MIQENKECNREREEYSAVYSNPWLTTYCLATVWHYNRLPKRDLQSGFEVLMATPPLWSHDFISGTPQLAHIYGYLQCPLVIWPWFMTILLKTDVHFQFWAKMLHSEQWVHFTIMGVHLMAASKGHKIRSSHLMTHFMIVTTYNHNGQAPLRFYVEDYLWKMAFH